MNSKRRVGWTTDYRLTMCPSGKHVTLTDVGRCDAEKAICEQCYQDAEGEAIHGAALIAIMVSPIEDPSERQRAISRSDYYVVRHLAHAARHRQVQACRPELDLTDTAELPLVPEEDPSC